MTPDQYCQDKAASSDSSIYYSFLFLPPKKRRAIIALHAFCREVGDVADECSDAQLARTTLNWWRGQVAQIYAGHPLHPVCQALVPAVQQFNLAQEHFLEIINGMEMDVDRPRYPDFMSLHLYCYRAASVAGRLSAEILGYADPKTLAYAHDLGIAFQLTQIIRDVGEDARHNRIYLPMDELRQFDVAATDILNARETENFHRLMAFQVARAEQYYRQALEHLPQTDRRAQCANQIMAAIHRTTLEEVKASGCHVLKERISLTPSRKLWLAGKTWLRP